MLRLLANFKVVDDLESRGVDHVHRIALAVRHVDSRRKILDRGTQLVGPVRRINVLRDPEREACLVAAFPLPR